MGKNSKIGLETGIIRFSMFKLC